MSVKLEFLGKCKDCKNAELELKELNVESINGDEEVLWDVSCSHESVCDMWDDRLSEEKARNV